MFLMSVLAIIILLFWVSKPGKQVGIILYFANIGSGKTTYLSKIAIQELQKMKKGKSRYKHILSNAQIAGVRYEPNIRKLLKAGAIQDTLILIDEGSIVYNNRKMVLTESEIQYFKLIRHYSSTCIVLSQSYDDIDVTLRRLYTEIYILRWLPLFTLIQPITKRVGIDEQTKQIIDEYRFKWLFSWRLFLRPVYFKYFNSWWIPEDVPIHDLEKVLMLPEWEKEQKVKGIISNKKILEKLRTARTNRDGQAVEKPKISFKQTKKKINPVKEIDPEELEKVEKMTMQQKLDNYYNIT